MNTAPVTREDARLRLTAFYRIAVNTGATTGNLVYLELADELHRACRAVITGSDPIDCLRDCGREWSMVAEDCADNNTGNQFRSWAMMITEGVEA